MNEARMNAKIKANLATEEIDTELARIVHLISNIELYNKSHTPSLQVLTGRVTDAQRVVECIEGVLFGVKAAIKNSEKAITAYEKAITADHGNI